MMLLLLGPRQPKLLDIVVWQGAWQGKETQDKHKFRLPDYKSESTIGILIATDQD